MRKAMTFSRSGSVIGILLTVLSAASWAAPQPNQPVFTAPLPSGEDWSKLPMRPLPQVSQRPLDKAAANFFVDAQRGSDTAAGTEQAPWKTVAHGLAQLKPGQTLVLRGGVYYESLHWKGQGQPNAPITLRAYPNELAILDAGLREFVDTPDKAWEPVPDGAPGEYQSVKAYPGANPLSPQQADSEIDPPRSDVYTPEQLKVGWEARRARGAGHFADSMVPLHPYRNRIDLQAENLYWIVENKNDTQVGIYCGPGLWLDNQGESPSHRLHVRLAYFQLPGLGRDNYRGPTDPRQVRLVVAGPGPALVIDGGQHLRVQDLVFRGARGHTLRIADAQDVELDGLTIYAGASCLRLDRTTKVRVANTAFRGFSAPWSFRNHEKYRGIDAFLVYTGGQKGNNRDLEFAYCELTDHHDTMLIDGAKSISIHHCYIDNFNDDGIDFGPKQADTKVLIQQNVITRIFQIFTLHGGKDPGPLVTSQPGSGVYICRNIMDQRMPVYARLPQGPDQDQGLFGLGRMTSDHGGPYWPIYRIYHNTILHQDPGYRDSYAAGMSTSVRGTERSIFNNIVVRGEELPGMNCGTGDEAMELDHNLLWSIKDGPAYKGDFLTDRRHAFVKGKFTDKPAKWLDASKKRYPDGWTAHDLFADPKFVSMPTTWDKPANVTLQKGSPAIDAGGKLPDAWPDPMRQYDQGKPDIGAVPLDAQPWTVGIQGRIPITKVGGFWWSDAPLP